MASVDGDQLVPRFSANQLVLGLVELKDKGNASLSRGDTKEAVDIYCRALARLEEIRHELDKPESGSIKAVLLANRAQAYLNLELWEEALEDATASLQIQPDNSKAAFRRDAAQKGLEASKEQRGQGEALKQALFCKGAGNKLLADGNARSAAEKYKDGLEWLEDLNRKDKSVQEVRIALLSNRSQAWIKQGLWKEALDDAGAVLVEDPAHPKARFRRAKALLELGYNQEAIGELRAIASLDPRNQDVAELLRRAEQPPERRDTSETSVARRPNAQQKVKPSTQGFDEEAKRVLRESEASYEAGDFKDALQRAIGAVGLLQKEIATLLEPQQQLSKADKLFQPSIREPPKTGAKETKQLLMAYTQEVRCRLALRDFEGAQETAARADKLHQWEETRLVQDFDILCGLKGAAPVVEILSWVCQVIATLKKGNDALSASRLQEARDSADVGLRQLELKEWPATAPLRAELLAVRAKACVVVSAEGVGTSLSSAEADAELALAIDSGCTRAKACLRDIRERQQQMNRS